jgi:cytosine/adenosine deaminase-related metal-dependent hydrolase
MAKQVLYNATILEGKDLEITRGYLAMRDGVIEKISRGVPPKRDIDLKRGFVLPPFVNAHTHLADSVAKDLYLGRTQPEVVGPAGEKLRVLASKSKKEIVDAVRATFRDMVKSGALAHCDFREGGVLGAKLLREASSRKIASIILGRPMVAKELNKLLMISDGVGLPSLNTFKLASTENIARRTIAAGKLLAVHAAETKEAQQSSLNNTGKTEIERALDLGVSFVVHATWASENDLNALRRARVPVVFCPRANSLLGVGLPPIHRALILGIRFCLGTDNATVCQPDMFRELAFAWTCLRRSDTKAGGDEARKLLIAASIEPLSVFNLPWGPIEEDQRATFLILARGHNLTNLTDIYSGLVNRARVDNLKTICIDGKIVKGNFIC